MKRQPVARGLVLLMLLSLGTAEARAETRDAETLSVEQLAALQLPPLPPLSRFNAILERPLFSPTRRPEEDDSGTVAGATLEELNAQWRLTGIMLVGAELKALLQQRSGDVQRILGTGMPLDDSWVLTEVHPDHIRLQAGDVQVMMQLHEPRSTERRVLSIGRTDNGNGTGDQKAEPGEPAPQGGVQ